MKFLQMSVICLKRVGRKEYSEIERERGLKEHWKKRVWRLILVYNIANRKYDFINSYSFFTASRSPMKKSRCSNLCSINLHTTNCCQIDRPDKTSTRSNTSLRALVRSNNYQISEAKHGRWLLEASCIFPSIPSRPIIHFSDGLALLCSMSSESLFHTHY